MDKTLIKWPGGKSKEIKYIENLIPKFERYIEPFFGGGAMYFYLRPKNAVINDISENLMSFYSLAKYRDENLYKYLIEYNTLLKNLIFMCDEHYSAILDIYSALKNNFILKKHVKSKIEEFIFNIKFGLYIDCVSIILNKIEFEYQIIKMVEDKMIRTVKNEQKNEFNDLDLKENLITGFVSGFYMYFRKVYNDILLKRETNVSKAYIIANFYFIREYCYGSMFRYNSKGEFNIPYGGMSYNRKDLKTKIDNIFSQKNFSLFENTQIHCSDFEDFLNKINICESDFMFLDPPYDTDFSDYEGNKFTKYDQQRLANELKKTKAKFILIIKNTDFIYSLYKDYFNILCFDKKYTYNVRSRNERNTEHLIITNISIPQ